jgi:hypothetical protein
LISYKALVLIGCVRFFGCLPMGGGYMPPIIGAARNGDVKQLASLIDAGADPNVRAGVNRWTPLMHAVHKNQPGSVQVLLSHGRARPNERGGSGTTALILAAGYGYSHMVAILLKAGADPHLKANNGEDALSAAVGGISDIDRFTVGRCQIETVRALLAAAPDLKLNPTSGARRIAKFAGCSDVLALVKQ